EHYRPKNLDEPSPHYIEGAVLSIADKLDSIVGCFAAGLLPSGTRDPFGLRRLGNGLIKVILDHKLKLSLDRLIDHAWRELAHTGIVTQGRPVFNQQLRPFFEDRLRYILEMRGFRYDEINAVMAASGDLPNGRPSDQPYETLQRAEALAKMRPE